MLWPVDSMDTWILVLFVSNMADEMSQKERVEIEQSIASLSSMCRGKLGVCTCRMNEVKALLAAGDNLESIKNVVDIFFVAFNEF